MNFCIKKET